MKTAFKYLFAVLTVACAAALCNSFFTPSTAIKQPLTEGYAFLTIVFGLMFVMSRQAEKTGRVSGGIFSLFIFALFGAVAYIAFHF